MLLSYWSCFAGCGSNSEANGLVGFGVLSICASKSDYREACCNVYINDGPKSFASAIVKAMVLAICPPHVRDDAPPNTSEPQFVLR